MHDLTLTKMLRQARIDALEEAARVCDELRRGENETNDWIDGTMDCAAAIRKLLPERKP